MPIHFSQQEEEEPPKSLKNGVLILFSGLIIYFSSYTLDKHLGNKYFA